MDPEQKTLLENALTLIQHTKQTPYTGPSGRVKVECIETHSSDAIHAILEGLTILRDRYEKVFLYTQNELRKTAVEHLGFLADLVHTPFNQDFHDLFWTTKIARHIEHQQISIAMHPTGIDPDRLWIPSIGTYSKDLIKRAIKKLTDTYPIETMFRNRNILSDGEISYSIPKGLIQVTIEQSEPEVREFIDSIYESWKENIESWTEDLITQYQTDLRYNSILVTMKNLTDNELHNITLSCEIPDSIKLLDERESDPITLDIPKLPILTQENCLHIERIPPETYLRLFGNDLDDCCLISPSYQEKSDTQKPYSRLSRRITSGGHRICYTIENILPYEDLLLPINFLYIGDDVPSTIKIDYSITSSGNINMGRGTMLIPTINKEISILHYIEELLERSTSSVL